MDVNMTMIAVALSTVSVVAGFIDSIAGGGGLLLIPALLVAGVPPQTVLGTNKFASTIGTSVAFVNFVRHKKVVWRIAAIGILFSLAGSLLGSKTILIFQNELVGKIIVGLLPLSVLSLFLQKKRRASVDDISPSDLYMKVPPICLMIGFYDGFFGPGTGSFLIIALYLLVGLDLIHASATAKAFNLASNIGALSVFLIEGKVIFLLGLPLAIANVAGNYLGSSLAIKMGNSTVRGFLFISLSILFISLFWKYFIDG
jgi:uncharacterized membrane protein YfcA